MKREKIEPLTPPGAGRRRKLLASRGVLQDSEDVRQKVGAESLPVERVTGAQFQWVGPRACPELAPLVDAAVIRVRTGPVGHCCMATQAWTTPSLLLSLLLLLLVVLDNVQSTAEPSSYPVETQARQITSERKTRVQYSVFKNQHTRDLISARNT